jgi:hypothetical protein
MAEPEFPSPWLPPAITNAKEKTETAKQKAHLEATLAETTQQVNTMILEYCELPFLSSEPEIVLQTTEASETSSTNVQFKQSQQTSNCKQSMLAGNSISPHPPTEKLS